jgi:hypothetical protein
MPKSPSGSGPPRRSKARAGEPGKTAPRPEAQILSPDARGDTSTEVPPAGVVIDCRPVPAKLSGNGNTSRPPLRVFASSSSIRAGIRWLAESCGTTLR